MTSDSTNENIADQQQQKGEAQNSKNSTPNPTPSHGRIAAKTNRSGISHRRFIERSLRGASTDSGVGRGKVKTPKKAPNKYLAKLFKKCLPQSLYLRSIHQNHG